jgi:UDP-N-acetyl-2-amino-2-deoxyglucuronate dehydrogenase
MSEKVKFAVVGCGHIGKRHMEMIDRDPEAELIAYCDIREKSELGIDPKFTQPYFNDIDEMLNAFPEIKVVNICSPNGLHAKQSLKALAHNKHIVCEKPMGLTKRECEKVIEKALDVSKKVFCVMQNRYSPPSVWLKEVMDKKLLGDVFIVQLNCYWNRDDRYYKKSSWKGTKDMDGGTLFTQFSHFIDIMYWLFGDITDIRARFEDFCHQESTDFEDTGIVNFRFVKGGIGTMNYSTAIFDSNLESSMTIIGSKGSIKVGGQYMDKIEYCNIKDYTMPELAPVNAPNDYGDYKGSAANHHYIIQNVINTIKRGDKVTTNALEGLKVVEIIERIYSLKEQ